MSRPGDRSASGRAPRSLSACRARLLVAAVLAACSAPPDATDEAAAYLALVAAEDARPTAGPDLDLLVAATADADPFLRRVAVRGLGRLEAPSLIDPVAAALGDVDPAVRAAAAVALAQAARGADDGGASVAAALEALVARAGTETDPVARGALARALGWLSPDGGGQERALEAVLALSGPTDDSTVVSTVTLLGTALAFEALLRSDDAGVSPAVAGRLEELFAYGSDDPDDIEAARVRALALTTLSETRRLTEALVTTGLEDPDAEVRRVAIRGVDIVVPSRRADLIRRALEDESVRVAIEATRATTAARTVDVCSDLVAATGPDRPPPLRVAALAALAEPCPGTEQGAALRAVAAEIDSVDAPWQPAAQALRSLTRIGPDAARRLLPRFVYHTSPFVRAHAAGAAASLRDADALYALASDLSPNVRTAAIDALFALEGRRVDDLLREQLSGDDPELLVTAARHLEGSADPRASAVAALEAFERISASRQETLRDPRLALLERVDESGDGSLAGRLRPYLGDYDPVVARRVGTLLDGWFGQPHEVAPEPLTPLPLPTVDELRALERTEVVLHARDLGEIVIRPLPYDALTNAWRFVRLAREGYYDGLTFHRWVANFVIQGGSPGANEHTGDGPFTRDEIGLPHWRGTVGLSTRGRDTGDAQFFINLADNVGLDAEYTVFAEVTEGLDVVDRVLEGTIIERIEVRERP